MAVMQSVACVWTLALTLAGFVCSDVQFLERDEGSSVVLPCVVDQRNPAPLGMYLKRTWLQPDEVLFMYTKREFTMHNNADKNRTSVSGDPSSHSLNVTISELRASDTDRYRCEFVVERPSSEDEYVPGKNEFFLLVNAASAAAAGGQCGCSSYSTLLYSLSSAVAVLILLLGCTMIYKGKSRRSIKSHPQAPIYEEMSGLKATSQKLPLHPLEEAEQSEYRNCHVKKSCPENHYESPSGALSPRS